MKRSELNFNDDKVIIDVFKCATEVFGYGLAVPSAHPCGWDWLDFSCISNDEDDILEYQFESYNISDGYGDGNYEGLTLREILIKTDGKFAFQTNRNNIDWNND